MNTALSSPPQSSSAIIHPSFYLQAVRLESPPALVAPPAFRVIQRAPLGEWLTAIHLREFHVDIFHPELLLGWRGDEHFLIEGADGTLMSLFTSRWASEAHAKAYESLLKARFAEARTAPGWGIIGLSRRQGVFVQVALQEPKKLLPSTAAILEVFRAEIPTDTLAVEAPATQPACSGQPLDKSPPLLLGGKKPLTSPCRFGFLPKTKGTVVVHVCPDADGQIENTRIVSSDLPTANDFLLQHMGQWWLAPTFRGGKPMSVQFDETFALDFTRKLDSKFGEGP